MNTLTPVRNLIHERSFGRAEVRRLEWDSEFFGHSFGSVHLAIADAARNDVPSISSLLCAITRDASETGYDHLILRLNGDEWPTVHAARRCGFDLVDVAQDLVRESVTPPAHPAPSEIREAVAADLPALADLAGRSFVYSRMAADPFFSAADVEAMHRQWIRNLFDGLARTVLVYETEAGLAGFIACSREADTGRIVLIATSAKERRRGVGAALVDASLAWFRGDGAQTVFVKTQAANVPALGLYQRAGFVTHRSEMTLSIDLRETPTETGGQQ